MQNQNLQQQYLDKVNSYLPQVDFKKLDHSCNSTDDSYAKEVIKSLHDLFVEVYGVDYLDTGYEFVDMPAVMLGRETGHIGLGLVYTIELERDHHVDFDCVPAKIADLLNHCPLDRPDIKLE